MENLKFRQIITDEDGGEKYFQFWGYLHSCTKGMPVFINPLGPVEWDLRPSEQFTGFKDATNETEVYRGDLLQRNEEAPVFEVRWNEFEGKFFLYNSDYGRRDISFATVLTVVDNIHKITGK